MTTTTPTTGSNQDLGAELLGVYEAYIDSFNAGDVDATARTPALELGHLPRHLNTSSYVPRLRWVRQAASG